MTPNGRGHKTSAKNIKIRATWPDLVNGCFVCVMVVSACIKELDEKFVR